MYVRGGVEQAIERICLAKAYETHPTDIKTRTLRFTLSDLSFQAFERSRLSPSLVSALCCVPYVTARLCFLLLHLPENSAHRDAKPISRDSEFDRPGPRV